MSPSFLRCDPVVAVKLLPNESQRIIFDALLLQCTVGFLYLISQYCVRMPNAVRDPKPAKDLMPPPPGDLEGAVETRSAFTGLPRVIAASRPCSVLVHGT